MQMYARALLLIGSVLIAACQRKASAQEADPALGPIECYEHVEDVIASTTGVNLCTGATSSTPGACFIEVTRRNFDLTTDQKAQLCHAATSFETLECYARLDAEGTLTDDQILDYCSMRCPLGPAPPQSSSAACVNEGLDRTGLASQQVSELCANSRSAGPVYCYLRGIATTQLPNSELIQLCTQRFSCQYVNAPPPQ